MIVTGQSDVPVGAFLSGGLDSSSVVAAMQAAGDADLRTFDEDEYAEGFPAGELKHGPLALVTPDTPVIAILTKGSNPAKTINNVKQVESRGAPRIGVTSTPEHSSHLDTTFEVPSCGPLEPVVGNVALQLFAYHVADAKDRPIDKPRNLAKSVTVE